MRPLLFLPISLLPLAMGLAGCSLGVMQKDYISRAETIPVTAAPASVGTLPVTKIAPVDSADAEGRATAAVLLPEGAGRIVRIREKNFSNGTRQEIILGKAPVGENVIDVSIRTASPNARFGNPLQIGPPSESGMRSEILSRFPDVQMNIVTRPMRNGLGPYGLAIGKHASGARCVFAWQWVEDLRENTPGISNVTKLNAMVANKGMATSIRVRLCAAGATVDQLAGQIEGLQAGSAQALQRIATMDRRENAGEVVAVGGAATRPVLRPVGASLEAALIKPVKRESAPRKVAAREAPSKKKVRRIVRREPEPDVAPPVYVPPAAAPAPANPYGRRYLAPVAGQAPQPAYGAGAAGQPAPGMNTANLPPQAYRGPGYPAQ